MKSKIQATFFFVFCCICILSCEPKKSTDIPLNPQLIEEASGLENLSSVPHVFQTSISRPDWITTSEGVLVTSALGLDSDITVQGTSENALMLGDLRIPENQTNDVLSLALAQNFEIQSFHNTYLNEKPRIMSLHILFRGRERDVSDRLKLFFDQLKSLPKVSNQLLTPKALPLTSTLNPQTMEKLLWAGKWAQGVYTVERGRGTVLTHGNSQIDLGAAAGIKSWASFTGKKENVLLTGEVATIQPELDEVLRTLIHANIKIVSIHSHLNGETPRVLFVHFWARGPVKKLARAFRDSILINENHQSN